SARTTRWCTRMSSAIRRRTSRACATAASSEGKGQNQIKEKRADAGGAKNERRTRGGEWQAVGHTRADVSVCDACGTALPTIGARAGGWTHHQPATLALRHVDRGERRGGAGWTEPRRLHCQEHDSAQGGS